MITSNRSFRGAAMIILFSCLPLFLFATAQENACSKDPAYQETMDKIADKEYVGKGVMGWKEWMVPPRDNSSGYAICYYNALAGKQYSLFPNYTDNFLPLCIESDFEQVSPQRNYDSRIRGFECGCPPPYELKTYKFAGGAVSYSCPAICHEKCKTQFNYECQNTKCVCKKGFKEVNRPGLGIVCESATKKFECDMGTPIHYKMRNLMDDGSISCVNNTFVARDGYKLVRIGISGNRFYVEKDYSCVTPYPNWYYKCRGPPKLELDESRQVCSRILDESTEKFMTFDSLKEMFDFASQQKCDCCFLDNEPSDHTRNPYFNYWGPCLERGMEEEVKCEDERGAAETLAGPACPVRAMPADMPTDLVSFKQYRGMRVDNLCRSIITGKSTLQYASEEENSEVRVVSLDLYDLN